MKAAVYRTNGDPEVLTFEDVHDPVVTPTTVLIRVAYAAIQGGDLFHRRASVPEKTPHVVGYQATGHVEAVGDAVTGFAVGDRVAGFAFAGSHAQRFAVEQQHAYPVPDDLDLAIAAAVPVEFGTASDGLFEFGRLGGGETVMIRGATGGVGIAAVQLAHRAGAAVIAVASDDARLRRAAALGADHVIDYAKEDVIGRVQALTGGRGVDLVLDMAGGEPLLGTCAFRGRYGLVGAAGGGAGSVTFRDLAPQSLTLFSYMFGREMGSPRVRDRIAALMRRVADGELSMPIERVFALSQAADAHRFAEQRHPVGRVLMKVDD